MLIWYSLRHIFLKLSKFLLDLVENKTLSIINLVPDAIQEIQRNLLDVLVGLMIRLFLIKKLIFMLFFMWLSDSHTKFI
jgi:hypothetical protein